MLQDSTADDEQAISAELSCHQDIIEKAFVRVSLSTAAWMSAIHFLFVGVSAIILFSSAAFVQADGSH